MIYRTLVILIIAVLLPAICYSEDYRYFDDAKLNLDGEFLVDVDSAVESLVFEVRAALHKNDERVGYSKTSWSLVWGYISPEMYYYAKMQCGNTDFGDFTDKRFAEITIGKLINGVDSVITRKRLYKGVDMDRGYNSLLMEWNRERTRIFIGSKEPVHVASFSGLDGIGDRCGVISCDSLIISSVVVETVPDRMLPLNTSWEKDSLDNYLSRSADKLEGYWSYLDRDNDEKRARLGGRYSLAIVKDGDGYVILYISGADVNRSKWRECMVKGRLVPTIFENHYDLVWYDSMMLPMETDIYADVIDGAILALDFPLYQTKIRFSKTPTPSFK